MTKKKLRVAMFIGSLPSAGGGVQEHVYYLSNELRRQGILVDVFGSESKSVRYRNFTPITYAVELPTLNGNWGYINFLKTGVNIKKIFSPANYDLLHVHEPYCPFATWDIIQNSPLPKVATFHNAWDDNSANNTLATLIPFFSKRFYENVGAAVYVSDITRKRWKTLCSGKTIQEIVYNGIDLSEFRPVLRKTSAKRTILFVGRLVKRKGIHFFLKSVLPLVRENPDIVVQIMGTGPEADWCKNFVIKHKLEKNVKLLGQIIGRRKIAYYQQAHVFCAPYSDEAHPITILEAMACGCTVVGFRNEAVNETLKDYPDPSLLVPQRNTAALTRALKKAVTDDVLQERIRAWCLTESRKYSWDKITKQTVAIYNRIT